MWGLEGQVSPQSPHSGRAGGQSTQDHPGKQIFELLQGGGGWFSPGY